MKLKAWEEGREEGRGKYCFMKPIVCMYVYTYDNLLSMMITEDTLKEIYKYD